MLASITTSIESHDDFPFVRAGLAHDLDPATKELSLAEPDDWWLEIDGKLQLGVYKSKSAALAEVESLLFADWNLADLIPAQIQKAVAAGDVQLALRLAEGKGRAIGVAHAYKAFSEALSISFAALDRRFAG